MASQEIHDFDKMIEMAEEKRWYVLPQFWAVGYKDKDGNLAGYYPFLFDNKKEAQAFSKYVDGWVVQKV